MWRWLGTVLGGWLSSWWAARSERRLAARTTAEHAENMQMQHEIGEVDHAAIQKADAVLDMRDGRLSRRVREEYID